MALSRASTLFADADWARVQPPGPLSVRFAIMGTTSEWDPEEPDIAPELWVHGASWCAGCGFGMPAHAPAATRREHGYCPACGAELIFEAVSAAQVVELGSVR